VSRVIGPEEGRVAVDPIAPGMLSGVYRAANSIARCVAVFHGPQGCHENLYASACFVHERPDYAPRRTASDDGRGHEPYLPSTVLADNDLVLGPEARLTAATAATHRYLAPELVLGISSDAAEIIGEDAGGLLAAAGLPDDTAAAWVDCAGFKGDWVSGWARDAGGPGRTHAAPNRR